MPGPSRSPPPAPCSAPRSAPSECPVPRAPGFTGPALTTRVLCASRHPIPRAGIGKPLRRPRPCPAGARGPGEGRTGYKQGREPACSQKVRSPMAFQCWRHGHCPWDWGLRILPGCLAASGQRLGGTKHLGPQSWRRRLGFGKTRRCALCRRREAVRRSVSQTFDPHSYPGLGPRLSLTAAWQPEAWLAPRRLRWPVSPAMTADGR